MRFNVAVAAFALVTSVTARSLPNLRRRQESIEQITAATPPPKNDSWYTAPAGLEDADPGDILKIRELAFLKGRIANASRIIQILYASTDSQYEPTFGVTTLLLPHPNTTTCNDKLLTYLVATDSADLNASPSYVLQTSGFTFGSGDVTRALGKGWWISVPDYEGPKASFTAGVQSGHSTIDSVRAVLNSDFGLSDSARYALWGYSGGALAGEWAAELQVQYAPELEFAGAALGGLTPNIQRVLETVNATYVAGLVPAGILGIATQWPELDTYVQNELNTEGPFNKTGFNRAYNLSLVQGVGAFAGQDITKYFKNGYKAIEAPIAQKVINRDGKMGYHGVPQFPLFIYQAIGDDISPIQNTDDLVNRYCPVGATIDYQRNSVGNHNSEGATGVPRAVAFLESVLSGAYNQTGCTIRNVTVAA